MFSSIYRLHSVHDGVLYSTGQHFVMSLAKTSSAPAIIRVPFRVRVVFTLFWSPPLQFTVIGQRQISSLDINLSVRGVWLVYFNQRLSCLAEGAVWLANVSPVHRNQWLRSPTTKSYDRRSTHTPLFYHNRRLLSLTGDQSSFHCAEILTRDSLVWLKITPFCPHYL